MAFLLHDFKFDKETYKVGDTIHLTLEYEGDCTDIVVSYAKKSSSSIMESLVFTLVEEERKGRYEKGNTTFHLYSKVEENSIDGHCFFQYALVRKSEEEAEVYKAEGNEMVPLILMLFVGKDKSCELMESAPIFDETPTFDVIK